MTMLGHLLTVWTIRISLLCYAAVLASELRGGRANGWPSLRRWVWTIGYLLFLAHVACAFHFFHNWSHQQAVAHTAGITLRQLGWAFGGGVYFNYVFGLVWSLDAAWMWIANNSYQRRNRFVSIGIHVYMAFIAVNGAIVFESGPTRWFSVAICVLLLHLLVLRIRATKASCPTSGAKSST